MTKIVTPIPVMKYDKPKIQEPDKAWWRRRIYVNADGNLMVQRYGGGKAGDIKTATWAEIEVFDGSNDFIDMGLDKISYSAVRIVTDYLCTPSLSFLDVLHDTTPTESPSWTQLTPFGSPHPDDRKNGAKPYDLTAIPRISDYYKTMNGDTR